MKKIQFYAVAVVFVIIAVLFVSSFVIVFGGVCNLFDVSHFNLGALSAFCMGFAYVGNRLAPIVRDFYDEAFANG